MSTKRIAALGLLGVVGLYLWAEFGTRYLSWASLSRGELVREIPEFVDRYDVGAAHACLYAVDCSEGRARMTLIDGLDDWGLEPAKDRIWKRRFSTGFCEGRTANIGLHLLPADDADPLRAYNVHARWSFLHDRYLPSWGRFQGPAAFSEEPWERCTPDKAVWHASN